jgi:hypothetical protein
MDKRFYVATSWDRNGHSPTQEELDAGIASFQDFPGAHAYNIAYWQPHLESDTLVPRIWQWIEHYVQCRVDYKSMPLAEKQVWFLVTPESIETENDSYLNQTEEIFSRNHIARQILDNDTFFDITENNYELNTGDTRNTYVRNILPRIYMQLHCLMDHMNREYGYTPLVFNKVSQFAPEFNAEFGKYFGNVPVLPQCISTYYSKPRILKHHSNERKLIKSDNGALTAFAPYTRHEEDGKHPRSHWVEDGKLGTPLTYEELDREYVQKKHDFFDNTGSFDFILNKELI